jgi:hypothetical protein
MIGLYLDSVISIDILCYLPSGFHILEVPFFHLSQHELILLISYTLPSFPCNSSRNHPGGWRG